MPHLLDLLLSQESMMRIILLSHQVGERVSHHVATKERILLISNLVGGQGVILLRPSGLRRDGRVSGEE